jgi:hypothetical protein
MKQRRYETRFEIEAEIEAYKQRAAKKLAQAEKLENSVLSLLLEANAEGKSDHEKAYLMRRVGDVREKIDALRRTYFLIFDRYIPELGRTLAAFQTRTFPFVGDTGVTIQK